LVVAKVRDGIRGELWLAVLDDCAIHWLEHIVVVAFEEATTQLIRVWRFKHAHGDMRERIFVSSRDELDHFEKEKTATDTAQVTKRNVGVLAAAIRRCQVSVVHDRHHLLAHNGRHVFTGKLGDTTQGRKFVLSDRRSIKVGAAHQLGFRKWRGAIVAIDHRVVDWGV